MKKHKNLIIGAVIVLIIIIAVVIYVKRKKAAKEANNTTTPDGFKTASSPEEGGKTEAKTGEISPIVGLPTNNIIDQVYKQPKNTPIQGKGTLINPIGKGL